MKRKLAILVPLFLILEATSAAKDYAPVKHVFVPRGIDSNDHAEVIVQGYLPNSCYSGPFTSVVMQGDEIDLTISMEASDPVVDGQGSARICPQVIVPYLKSVNLGVLPSGIYELVINRNSSESKRYQVEILDAAAVTVDHMSYAFVTRAWQKSATGRTVVLEGEIPSPCFALPAVEFISNENDTITILPVLERISNECPFEFRSFRQEVEIPPMLEGKEVMLHIRSMDGKSINLLFKN